ncbi:MAG: tRNA (adenosine(37)-N6)-threonylcarbamoyltransferase complex transferase subunit TsaD [Planctomycetaceae bacterium]|nr:tRNA (adenosine(37)-N6)-threonylcarbamoyltransferase complex transferase subunit TsaD [Planctomycetaceae bacterium]
MSSSAAPPSSVPLLLAIESSCDETAAAVIARDLTVRSTVVASQDELHERFGGVVPEIASRAHLERLLPVLDEAVQRAGIRLNQLSAIAVATEPGLVGSLLVGLTAAKTLAAVLDIPLIAINHIEAHLYACRMTAGEDVFPAAGMVVSGGHTSLFDCPEPTGYQLVGSTIDDAAGEAFDKVARILGLSYPGGPSIQRAAEGGDPAAFGFPRTFLQEDRLRFSFSGLKTAVLYAVQGIPGSHREVPPLTPQRVADVAASFEQAVVDVLMGKCRQLLRQYNRRTLLVGGGVAANRRLREALDQLATETGTRVILAPPSLCTDNAAMAGIAWEQYDRGQFAPLDTDVTPGLVRLESLRGR